MKILCRGSQTLVGGLLIGAVLLALGNLAEARPLEQRVNVREACRREVAGAYLEAYDLRERTADYATALTDQVKELDGALVQARQAFAKAKAAAETVSYDVGKAAEVDRAASVLRAYEQQRNESEAARVAAVSKVLGLSETEKTMRKAVETLFVLTRTDDRPDGGYPFRIEYRSPCPKYRFLCPLPPADADKLAKLEIRGIVPDSCRRYSSLSRIP